jgi:hypothetical protein
MALIQTRDEFHRTLDATAAEMDGLAARHPDYPVWVSLQKQLHAMQQWSAGRDPTPDEQAKITIGLMVARELDPPPTRELQGLVDRLFALSYAWRHWPPGPVKR